jgi:hypothetical protein
MPSQKSVYVASSVNNPYQPVVVEHLRALGWVVYDFHQPFPGKKGFRWEDITPSWREWGPETWRCALNTPAAKAGFDADFSGMQNSKYCVLVLPSGRSAHLEAGYMAGQGKNVFTLALEKVDADLMNLLLGPAENICVSIQELLDKLERSVIVG